MKAKKKTADILRITRSDQYQTVEELLVRSQPNSVYYTLLIVSAFIITAGLLLENAAITIGGMLVTPVLTPVLVIALGAATRKPKPAGHALLLIAKSVVILVLISFTLALLFEPPTEITVFDATLKNALLYFMVAFASGIAATFAWVRKEVSSALPGIAIAVALVPPLSLIGIGLALFDLDAARYNLYLFLFNLIGIFLGSMIVFILLQFSKVEKKFEDEEKGLFQADL